MLQWAFSRLGGRRKLTPAGRVTVLFDPDDDAAVIAKLLARHDPSGGCMVVHPTPGAGGKGSLAYDLLAALGRPVTALEQDRLGGVSAAWRSAAAWMVADRIEHLVVLRAHLLDPATALPLIELAADIGTALLLVVHAREIPLQLRLLLGSVGMSQVDVHDAVRELDAARSPAPVRQVNRQYPALPHHLPKVQLTHYRADVYRKHAGAAFTRVDALYGRGLDTACRWLRRVPGPVPRNTWDAEPQVQLLLTKLVHDSPTPRHTLAMLRGVQAGFLLHGFWLTMPRLDGLCGPGVTSRPVTADVVERIRAGVAHPVLAAGVALAMFTGLRLISLRSLAFNTMRPDCQTVAIPFAYNELSRANRIKVTKVPARAAVVFYVPTAARPLLQAAREYMRRHSGREYPWMFHLFSPMIDAIEQAAARCGLELPGKTEPVDQAWQLRVRWSALGEPVHGDAGCQPGQPPGADLASAAPLYRHPADRLGTRWLPSNVPHFLPDLLRAYLDGTAPTGSGFREGWLTNPDQQPYPQWMRLAGLVEQHLAVRVPPTDHTPGDQRGDIVMHPDIAFGLRLASHPAPA